MLLKNILLSGLACLFIVFLSTCGEDSGLGATVDTESPKLSIEYPPAAATVKGSFVFAGTCSDDKGIARVEVSVKNLDSGHDYGKSLADVESSRSWTISLNKPSAQGFEYPDGKYQFEVTAYDKSGRSSGTSARQFDIDNTAPVFVITKPGVVRNTYLSNSAHSKYGSLFSIEGTIADEHSIATMDVNIYDKDGNPVASEPYSEQEISTTGGTSVTIARFVNGSNDLSNTRYQQIYSVGEADSAGNKIYSCTVTVTDSAKEYTEPGDSGSGSGNATSTVWLYDDIYEDLMSAKKGAGLSANDLRSVLNGTATDEKLAGKGSVNATVSQVYEALSKFARDTSDIASNSLSFSLNPNADPTYNISGFQLVYNKEETALSSNTNKAMGEQPLTIIVSAGLDQVNIVPSSLKVWIRKISSYGSAPLTKSQLSDSIESLAQSVRNLEQFEASAESFEMIDGWKLVHDNSSDNSPTDTTVTVSTEIPGSDYIESDSYYAIAVTGHDKDEIYLSQVKNFGFLGTRSAVPPTVFITSPKNLAYFKNSNYIEGSETDSLFFEGTATESNAGLTLKALKATLSVTDETTGMPIPDASIEVSIEGDADYNWTSKNGFTCSYEASSQTYHWKFIPSLCDDYAKIKAEDPELLYMYTLTVEATGGANLKYSESRNVHIDTGKPTVTIYSVSPTVSGADYFGESSEYKDYTFLNGNVTVQGSIVDDSNLKEVTYDIWASADLSKELTSADSIFAQGFKEYAEQGTALDGIIENPRSFKKTIPTGLVTKFFIEKKGLAKDQPLQAAVIIRATDTVGNECIYQSKDENGRNFIVYQETDRPKITLGNASENINTKEEINVNTNLFGTSNNNRLSVSFTDDDSVVDYEIYVWEYGTSKPAAVTSSGEIKKTSGSVNYTLPSKEGVYNVEITTRDFIRSDTNTDVNNPYGIRRTKEFLVAVDSGAPTLSVSNPQNGDFVSRESGITYTDPDPHVGVITEGAVRGTVSKREGTTISGFVYSSTDDSKTQLVQLENVTIETEPVNGVFKWSGTIATMPPSGASFKLEITAEDSYQQKSSVTVNLGIDDRAPTILLAPDERVIIESNQNVSEDNGVKRYLISGSWKDSYEEGEGDNKVTIQGTGTNELYYSYATTVDEAGEPVWSAKETVEGTAKSAAETKFNFYISPLTEGKNFAYKVWGNDAAGNNSSPIERKNITVDLSLPSIQKTSGDVPQYVKAGQSLTISGSYSDSHGIKTVRALAKLDGTQVASGNSGYTFTDSRAADGKSGTFTITLEANESNNGNWTFEITAEDLADRKSGTLNFSTLVDTVKPVWNDDTFLIKGNAYNPGSGEDHTGHSWYKDSSLPFAGSYTENGSGIDHIKYTVIQAGQPTGTDDTISLREGQTSFSANIGEFISAIDPNGKALANTVTLTALDKAGNESEPKTVYIFVDSEGPTVTSDQTGSQYSNKSLAITVTGAADDNASGIESVELTVTEDGQTDVKTSVNATSTDSFANWTATIPSSFLSGLEDKTYAVKATVTDKAGNKSTSKLFSIDVDAEKPVIKNVSLSDEGGTYSVYETKEKIDGVDKTVYYIHSGNNFLLSGSVQDSKSGIKSIVVTDGTSDIVSKIGGKDVTALPVTLNLSSYTDSVTLKITATDNAGNTESQDLIVKIDNDLPVALHAIDENLKDVFFRINENDNDDISSSDPLWNDNLDKDVGGKYAEGTYGNSKTIKIRGTVKDSGSGVAMIYYKVIEDAASPYTQDQLNVFADNFLKNYKTEKTGYFAPGVLPAERNRRVFYSGTLKNALEEPATLEPDSGEYKGFVSDLGSLNSKSYATVTSNFNSVLSGFNTEKNYLFLVYVDNVGNSSLESVKSGGTEYKNVSINVDQTTPDGSSSVEGLKYTNKKGTMEFSGTASDADSGLYSITLKQGTKEIVLKNDAAGGTASNENGTLSITKTDGKDKEWTWTATVNNDKFFAGASGTVSVSLEVKDCAGIGNTKSINVATVIVDTQLDSITLSAPTDADSETEGTQVNGTITLKGTMSDTNVLPTTAITRIEYKGGDASDWKDLSTKVDSLELTGNYTFTVTGFDTTKLSDGAYQLRAVGTDSAGNLKESDAVSVTVSQDSDRPKVNFNNIDYNGTLEKFLLKHGTNSQVTGRISDDDATGTAVVKKFIVSETEYKGGEGETEPANLLGTSLTSSGDFTITPSNKIDGEKTFYIYIEDNGGKKFYTTYTSASASAPTNDKLQNPKILVKNNAAAAGVESAVFKYISDSLNPTIGKGKGLPYSAKDNAKIAKDSSNKNFDLSDTNSNLGASFVAGGSERRYVKFYFTGSDASGIASMSATFTLPEGNSETTSPILSTGDSWNGTNNSTEAAWTTDFVDIASWGSGQVKVKLTVQDKVGLDTSGEFSFYIDNSEPQITILTPESGEEKTGVVTISGTASDIGMAGAANIYWIIPKITELPPDDSTAETRKTTLKALNWNGGTSSLAENTSVAAWGFTFDGNYDKESSDEGNFIFKAGNPQFDIYDSEDFTSTISDGIYRLPVYFMAVDALGNYCIREDFVINHNPDGDRPKVTFTYPTKESYDTGKSFATLGGTISLTGSAEIPSNTTTVRSVYIQIADDTGKFNATDKNTAQTKYGFNVVDAYTVINAIKRTSYSQANMTDDTAKSLGFASKADMNTWWGIEATGKASWRIQINSDGKMNPDSGTNDVKIRACAVNANGKMGAWTQGDNVLSIHIDNGVPVIMNQLVNQYSGSDGKPASITSVPAAAAISSQHYTTDMFLRGKWTLVFDVLDESGIASVTVKNGTADVTHYKESASATINGTAKSGYRVYVPIDDSVTAITYSIEATETGDAHSTKASFSFKIDNKAPTIEGVKNGKDAVLANGAKIQNDNYVFTLKGSSDDYDGGSGVEHVAFYYMRKSGKTQTSISNQLVFDPMIKPNGTNYEDVKVGLDGLTGIEFDGTSEKLYAKSVGGAVSADSSGNFSIFTASSSLDSHIRAGSLVKIDGIFRKIISVSGNVVTFNPAATAASASSQALFPIAMIIDANNTAKTDPGNSANPFVFDSGKDDGDGMVESFSKSGSVWSWDATIHCDNMSDGPATLVILAFDNAGNVSAVSYNVMISNNAPRLAKVFLATDLNHDDEYSENEFETYNIGAETGNTDGLESYSLKTAGFKNYAKNLSGKWIGSDSPRKAFTIKKNLAVLPEIVGGNGDIKLVFNSSDTTTGDGKQTGSGSSLLEDSGSLTLSGQATGDKDSEDNPVGITGKYWDITSGIGADTATSSSTTSKAMSFTFWDSTEETTPGTNSQYTFLRVEDFIVDQTDDVAPNVVVNPFFWEGEGEGKNSLYKGSKANGHIELEADLTEAIKTLYENDPKVSGKIVIQGTAYDETLLGKLSFSMTNFKSSTSTALTMAEFKTTTGENGKKTSAWTVESKKMESDSYEVTVENEYMNQNGHKVKWTVAIDTAALSDVAHENAVFTVIAGDQKSGTANSSVSSTGTDTGTTDATKHKPAYQMDVVPYITGIKTDIRSASGLKDNNIRSASGKYSILANNAENVITVTGFNFSTSTDSFVAKIANKATSAGTTITATEGGTGLTASASDTNTAKITNSGITKSGYLEIFSNDVRALNNINANDAYGKTKDTSGAQLTASNATVSDYAQAYNREPDYYTTKNVQLTDDRYLRFFDMKDTGVKNGYYPTMVLEDDDPVFGLLNLSGDPANAPGPYPAYSMAQRAKFKANGTKDYIEYLANASVSDMMCMARDDSGRFHHISVFNRDSCGMYYIYDRFSELYSGYGWAPGIRLGSGWTYVGALENNGIALESVNYQGLMTGRYMSPKMIAKGDSADATASIYIAYYDDNTGEIIIRDFMVGKQEGYISDGNNITLTARDYGSYFRSTRRDLAGHYIKVGTNYYLIEPNYDYAYNATYEYYNISGYTTSYTGSTYSIKLNNSAAYSLDKSNKDNSDIIYNQAVNFIENICDTSPSETYSTGRISAVASTNGSRYFDIGIVGDSSDNYHIVLAYVDKKDNKLKLKYSTDVVNGSKPTADIQWTPVEIPFPDNVTSYVSLAVDGNAVHIAAFDSFDSNLVYMYLPNYNSAENYKAITVDQASAVGNWTKVKIKDGIPYIAYYNSTETGGRDCIKLAYPVATNGLTEAENKTAAQNKENPGVDVKPGSAYSAVDNKKAATGYTTGAWEYMTVPAITPPQGGDPKFQNVCLDFDTAGKPVVGYLGTNLEFGKWLDE